MRRICACSSLTYCVWLSVGPRMRLEVLLWRLWGAERDNVIHTGFLEGEMQTLSFLCVWKFKVFLCERHCWSTQKIVPSQVSVYMWTCHECRDCLYSRGSCCATTCVFCHQCFPVYPPNGCQNKVHVLCDNTWIIFYSNIPRCVPPLNNKNCFYLPWGTKASISSKLDLSIWESHEQQEQQITLVSWSGRRMSQARLLKWLCYINSGALEATRQELFRSRHWDMSTSVQRVMEMTGLGEEASAGKLTWCYVVNIPWVFPFFLCWLGRHRVSFAPSVCICQ